MNKDKAREASRKWYINNKDKAIESNKKWRKNNADKIKEYSRIYMKKWRIDNIDKVKEYNKRSAAKQRQIHGDSIRLLNYKRLGIIPTRPMPDLCEICGLPEQHKKNRVLSLDHDHISNKFRGWICNKCNYILERVKDSSSLLRKMADYLDKNCE